MGQVRVLHVLSSRQFTSILTKGLPSPLFLDFRSSLNVCTHYVTLCDVVAIDISYYVT
jgi:hypothetical protein